jgi:hypothetical protein
MDTKTYTIVEVTTLGQAVAYVTIFWDRFVTVACEGETEDGPAPLSPAHKQRLVSAIQWLWDNGQTHTVDHIIPADFWPYLLNTASKNRMDSKAD